MRKLLTTITVIATLTAGNAAFADNHKKKSKVDDDAYYDIKDTASTLESNDPWEGFNRPIFDFNVGFDRYVMKPFIYAYDVIPAPARHRFGDFLNNLGEPLNVVHGVLQLDPEASFTSLWRFILNSTLGFGGLRDFAGEDAGLKDINQNLGKTLGAWGVPTGPYVVLPILGPSSVRDTTGKIGDSFADPIGWNMNMWWKAGQGAANGIDARDRNAGIIEQLYYESLDPYAATRSAYRQNEAFKAKKQ
jgi:phospholipid-binding lipoprotein MlaA